MCRCAPLSCPSARTASTRQCPSCSSAQPLSLPPPQLDPALWDAFEQRLLYHMYHDELPGALGLSHVLQLAQLADRFQVGERSRPLS